MVERLARGAVDLLQRHLGNEVADIVRVVPPLNLALAQRYKVKRASNRYYLLGVIRAFLHRELFCFALKRYIQ